MVYNDGLSVHTTLDLPRAEDRREGLERRAEEAELKVFVKANVNKTMAVEMGMIDSHMTACG